MPFSKRTVQKALAACGRCCCICHKFCGTDIEVHHIQREGAGGPNTFENAIPLCYTCHASMGRIDPHHPKGRGYTPDELKLHRDRWYELVKEGKTSGKSEIKTGNDEDKDYERRYKNLKFIASCILDYYANVYTDVTDTVDDRHEKASKALRIIGVMIRAFASEERTKDTSIPDEQELLEAGGLFIGLSNSLYTNNNDNYQRLDANLRSEDRIREIMGLHR